MKKLWQWQRCIRGLVRWWQQRQQLGGSAAAAAVARRWWLLGGGGFGGGCFGSGVSLAVAQGQQRQLGSCAVAAAAVAWRQQLADNVVSTAVAMAAVVAAQQRHCGSLAVAWRWRQLGSSGGGSGAEAARQH